jgi:hypothetical protein
MEEWLKQNLPEVWEKEVWPPSSLNNSLLDFFVWGVSELWSMQSFAIKSRT